MEREVVITGLGVVCANARNLQEFRQNLEQGISGIGAVSLFDVAPYRCKVGGQIHDEDRKTPANDDPVDRAAKFALEAALMAMEDAAIDAPWRAEARIGIVLGTTMGGIVSFEQFYKNQLHHGEDEAQPALARAQTLYHMTNVVADHLELNGPKATVTIACASGTNAIGYAADLIKAGKADIMLAGGSDALSEFVFSGFSVLRAITTKDRIRPHDKNRDGTVLGEGAGILVLESEEHARARRSKIYARYKGHGFSNDAFHPTQPDRDGGGLIRAMNLALAESNITKEHIDYINLHGTATKANDVMETNALKAVFAEHIIQIAASTIKPMVGHTLGAAGAIEAIATVLSVSDNFLPPTLNFESDDPECDIDVVPNHARKKDVRAAMSISAAFSGNTAAVIFAKYDREN